jgi:hypothetical protein
VLLLVFGFWPQRKLPVEEHDEPGESPFPVPPMDLVVPPSPRLAVASAALQAGGGDEAGTDHDGRDDAPDDRGEGSRA